MASLRLALLLAAATFAPRCLAEELKPYQVVGDAIPQPLTTTPGDPARGIAIVVDRRKGLCLLCHSGPFPEERFQGELAPSLEGSGDRLDAGALRLRIVDSRRVSPATIMPAYYETSGRTETAAEFKDRPILDAQEIEDVVAFLQTLKKDGSK